MCSSSGKKHSLPILMTHGKRIEKTPANCPVASAHTQGMCPNLSTHQVKSINVLEAEQAFSGIGNKCRDLKDFPSCIRFDLGNRSRTEAGKQVMGKSRQTLKDKGHSSGAQHFLVGLLDCYSVIQSCGH